MSNGRRARWPASRGRYYAMDRDNRWERVERGATKPSYAPKPLAAIGRCRGRHGGLVRNRGHRRVRRAGGAWMRRGVRDGDAVVFFNFRPDRAREITRAIVDPAFAGFDRERRPQVHLRVPDRVRPGHPGAGGVPEGRSRKTCWPTCWPTRGPAPVPHRRDREVRPRHVLPERRPRGAAKAGEQRRLIPSPKVATYDLQPQMSEPEVADTLAAAIDADEADVYIVNFANPDMVGHTGVIPAAVAAVEAVDAGVSKVRRRYPAAKAAFAFITADHGNCRQDDRGRWDAPYGAYHRKGAVRASWTVPIPGGCSATRKARCAISPPRCSTPWGFPLPLR